MADQESVAGLQAAAELASTSDKLRAGTSQAVNDASAMMRNLADQQMHKLGSRLGGVAQALHETAKHLERQNATAGRYADMAARRMDRVTEVLKERRVDELVDDAEDFARDQPLLFVGGALAAGFLLARVVRSGESTTSRRRMPLPVESEPPGAIGGGVI